MEEDHLVSIAGGLTVPAEAYNLALDLERRGLTLRVEEDRLRVSGPDGKPDLSEAETTAIKRWKPHLIALTEYIAPERSW